MERLWTLVTILGPILLLSALIWAYLRNRDATRADIARADRGAREVREEIARDEAKDG